MRREVRGRLVTEQALLNVFPFQTERARVVVRVVLEILTDCADAILAGFMVQEDGWCSVRVFGHPLKEVDESCGGDLCGLKGFHPFKISFFFEISAKGESGNAIERAE